MFSSNSSVGNAKDVMNTSRGYLLATLGSGGLKQTKMSPGDTSSNGFSLGSGARTYSGDSCVGDVVNGKQCDEPPSAGHH